MEDNAGHDNAGQYLDIYSRFVDAVLRESREQRAAGGAIGDSRGGVTAMSDPEHERLRVDDSSFPEFLCAMVPRMAQRQDSLNSQLNDLYLVAVRFGMYDAADALRRWQGPGPQSEGQPR